MTKKTESQAIYGRKGQAWHEAFINYMEFIANHDSYKGMPDAFVEGNKIQWEAPSNRASGKYKDTHHKRRDWWRSKAVEVGINDKAPEWISRTAKNIHPTKKKPCKRCGRVMDIRYAYPQQKLLRKIGKLFYIKKSFNLEPLEHITSLITNLHKAFGDRIFQDLRPILKTSHTTPPETETLFDWLTWIEESLIPSEPRFFSPGAMSNAPDRFDGFHSFNLCCRSKADTGRHKLNLTAYTTDRRVFEYWSDGDWIAADRLMGILRSKFRTEPCLNGHPGPCSADHVGPLSLGFSHYPQFQLLCRACNSSKNNRMTHGDAKHLIATEQAGIEIMSWHSKKLWDLKKGSVKDEETALRLSKLLRDNRHTFMHLFKAIAKHGHYTFLAKYLNLDYANFDVEFINLTIKNSKTHFDNLIKKKRETKYAAEQKARRFRVAFSALFEYFTKPTRNAYVVTSDKIDSLITEGLRYLSHSPKMLEGTDEILHKLFASKDVKSADEQLRSIILLVPEREPDNFILAREQFKKAMELVAHKLNTMWEDERYIRTPWTEV